MTDKVVSEANVDNSRVKRVKAAASVNNTLVQGVPGVVDGYSLSNSAAYAVFFKLYDKATAPVAGTDVPAFTVLVPAGATVNGVFTKGVRFTVGIGFAITKLVADTDTTVVVADDLSGVLAYR